MTGEYYPFFWRDENESDKRWRGKVKAGSAEIGRGMPKSLTLGREHTNNT